jgi:hypothetical protein
LEDQEVGQKGPGKDSRGNAVPEQHHRRERHPRRGPNRARVGVLRGQQQREPRRRKIEDRHEEIDEKRPCPRRRDEGRFAQWSVIVSHCPPPSLRQPERPRLCHGSIRIETKKGAPDPSRNTAPAGTLCQ